MKLYTYDEKSSLESCNQVKLSLEEYSSEKVEEFLKEASNYSVDFELYSYETDMSDHEEISRNEHVEITAKNIVIKDNKFYGCLGWTSSFYETYGVKQAYVVSVDNIKVGYNDSGGYNEFYYYWTLTKRN